MAVTAVHSMATRDAHAARLLQVVRSWKTPHVIKPAVRNLELPDKTIGIVPDENYTRGELDPAEIPFRGTIQPPRDPSELGQKRMAALYRTANPTDSRLPSPTTLRRFHPEARRRRPFLARAIAIRSIRPRVRQIATVRLEDGYFGRRGLDNQRLQYGLGFDAVVDVRSANDRSQWHAVGIARYVDGRTRLTAIHRRRPRVFTPFFDGFLEPSRRT